MAKYRITAPVERYEGEIADVRFIGSVAETDNTNVVEYCRRHGYKVELVGGEAEPSIDGDGDGPGDGDGSGDSGGVTRPKDNAPKPDWVAYAVSKGADEAEATKATQKQLIELYG